MRGSASARNKVTFISMKRKLLVLIFINSAYHFGAQSTKDGKLCGWHPHYCLLCSLLLQVWCEIKMWIKLVARPSPKLTVQAVPQKSGEPLTYWATHAIAATTALSSPLLYGQTGQEQPLPRSQHLPFESRLTHFRTSVLSEDIIQSPLLSLSNSLCTPLCASSCTHHSAL